jgi:soluble lytic murein transglycosylase-like protein
VELLLVGLVLLAVLSGGGAAVTLPANYIAPGRVLAMIEARDRGYFKGWFSENGRSPLDVLAVVKTESNYDANAVGDLFTADKSWGLGQVRLTTANDFGSFPSGELLLDPETNIAVMMAFMQWNWRTFEKWKGRPPTRAEWFGAYNAGIGNATKGVIPTAYVAKVEAARRAFV